MKLYEIDYTRHQFAARGLLVLSQWDAMVYEPEVPAVLIRIRGDNPTKIKHFEKIEHLDKYTDIIEFSFDDVDPSKRMEKHNALITSEMAEKIVAFFAKYEKTHLMVIHCQGGVSRSSAVGCAYAYFKFDRELEEDLRQTSCFVPNAFVYRQVVEAVERYREAM